MSDNRDNLFFRALAGLPVEPPSPGTNLLLGLGPLSPDASALSALFAMPPTPAGNALNAFVKPRLPVAVPPAIFKGPPQSTLLGSLPVTALPTVQRMSYFAFSFDDVMRVNNVRHTGKIGPRVIGRSRGFLDRSIWEKRNIKNVDSLKRLMQQAATRSSVVCVLIGSETWRSRWVRYEIALAVINEKGLLTVHINSINFVGGTGPDPLGLNPLHFIGIHRDESGKYYLVERKLAVLNEATGDVGFKWHWYEDYQLEVPRPKYMPELAIGGILPLSTGTKTFDFMADQGSKNIGIWLDAAAIEVDR